MATFLFNPSNTGNLISKLTPVASKLDSVICFPWNLSKHDVPGLIGL